MAKLTDEQLREIGRLAVEWSDVEWVVFHLLSVLITDEVWVSAAVVAGDRIDDQLDRIKGLLDGRIPRSEQPKFTAWVDEVRRLKDARNRVVHSVWFRAEDEDERPRLMRLRRKGDEVMQGYTEADLRKLADEADKLSSEGFELWQWTMRRCWPDLHAYLSGEGPQPPYTRTPPW